jgi:uncharacterized protein (TIGR04222 family)
MPNPFDLRGPDFLVFYGGLGFAVTIVVFWLRRAGERGDPPRPLSDYLDIAFLRGGAGEAIRVATLTLVDRGVLAIAGDTVRVEQSDASRRVTRPTERAIVLAAGRGTKAADLLNDARVTTAATTECEPGLVRQGLIPNADQAAARRRLWLMAGGALAIVAGVKIAIAMSRGHSNIGYLVTLAVIFVVVTFLVTHPRRTPAGNVLVADLETLFGGLKDRAGSLQPQQGGSDFALLAAVFGVGAALPIHPEATKLFPRTTGSGGSSYGDSSGGSSGASSCGGGGGGCGGCGS